MQLIEEYLRRHKLSVPVIRHVQSGFAFFRQFDGRKMNWHVMSIDYDFDAKRPSQYVIQWMAPGSSQKTEKKAKYMIAAPVLYDPAEDQPAPATPVPRIRNNNSGEMMRTEDRVVISWDEYEDFLLKTARKKWEIDPESAILDGKEIFVTAWEMFVYAYEKSFVPLVSQDDFFDTLDAERKTNDRHEALRRILTFLKKSDTDVWSQWVQTVEPMLQNYCFWLASVLRKR